LEGSKTKDLTQLLINRSCQMIGHTTMDAFGNDLYPYSELFWYWMGQGGFFSCHCGTKQINNL